MKLALISSIDLVIPDPNAPGYSANPDNPPVLYKAGTILGFVNEAVVIVSDSANIGDQTQ